MSFWRELVTPPFVRMVGYVAAFSVVLLLAGSSAGGGFSQLGLAIVVVLVVVGLIGFGVVLGQRLLTRAVWHRPVRFTEEPPPKAWEEIVRRNFTAARDLTDEDFERLLRLVQVFVRDSHFEGAQGLEITEEIRVTIAAQACYLLLWNGLAVYPRVRSVVVYPSTFVTATVDRIGNREEGGPVLGLASHAGAVVLAWDNTLHGGFNPGDRRNVVFHEFAHQLDHASGEWSGTPAGLHPSTLRTWARMLGKSYLRLVRAARRQRRVALDHYGAKNHAEFFAVATEAFFESPKAVKAEFPDLYEHLADFYARDPLRSTEMPPADPS